MNDGKYFDAWAIIYDGKVTESKDEIGIGVVSGYTFQVMADLLDSGELYEAMCLDEIEIPDGAIAINFRGTNLYREEGQMTFPETGQWDFPPYWMFDLKVTGFDYLPEKTLVSPVELSADEIDSAPF